MPHPANFMIDKLLANGMQPWDDLDDETFETLIEGIKTTKVLSTAAPRLLAQTVTVALVKELPGYVLVDGHQRLRALRRLGKHKINLEDVTIVPVDTMEEADRKACELNNIKRTVTPEMKAARAREYQRKYGWSQSVLAQAFGVGQPTISKWLAMVDDGRSSGYVTGADGKTYPARLRRPKPRMPAVPSLPEWIALADTLRAQLPINWHEVPEVWRPEARHVLTELAEAVDVQLQATDESPAPFPDDPGQP